MPDKGSVNKLGHAPVAQLDRARPSEGRGQGFESLRARHFQMHQKMTKTPFGFFLPLLTALLLSACAGPVTVQPQGTALELQRETMRQKELAYKKYIADQDRVFNIAFPILAANADFCGAKVSPSIGITAWNIPSVEKSYQQAAVNVYNLQNRLAVQFVADNSPAARAGISSGDIILAINDRPVPAGPEALRQASRLLKEKQYTPSVFALERAGKNFQARVSPVTICNFPVMLDNNSSDVNAYADGKRIVVSKGIVRFSETDDELALVIAHELAHSALLHVDKKKQNALAGSLGGLAIDSLLAAAGVASGNEFSRLGGALGAESYSVEFEQEADYVGMYFMERAGYSSRYVADFWRRMAAEHPNSVTLRRSHPTSPERFIAIERISAEISGKKSRGQQLLPNFGAR